MGHLFESEDPREDELETQRLEAEPLPRRGYPSPTMALAAAIRISNEHDRARRRFNRAIRRYNGWIARLLRVLGIELPHLARRLARARDRYVLAQEALELARQDVLVARNAARFTQGPPDLRGTAEMPTIGIAHDDAQAGDEFLTWAMDHRRPQVIATTRPLRDALDASPSTIAAPIVPDPPIFARHAPSSARTKALFTGDTSVTRVRA